jgi:tripartite ATP-independent transporter DctM subunit
MQRRRGSISSNAVAASSHQGRPAATGRSFEAAFVRLAAEVLLVLSALCLAGIIAAILLGVISRYGFNASLTWTDELGRILFITLIFLGLPANIARGEQLSLTYLVDRAAERVRYVFELLSNCVVAFTLFMVAFNSWTLIGLIRGTTAALQVPNWLIYSAAPVSGVVGLVVLALVLRAAGKSWPRALVPLFLGFVAFGAIDLYSLVRFTNASPSLVMGICFVVTLFIGTPIAFAMLASTFMAVLGADILPAPAVIQNMVAGAGKYLLLAIPFFLMTGQVLNQSGLSHRLMDFAKALVGHFRGGLAQVNVLSSLMFGGISGSSTSDAALDTKILVPQMVRHGYKAEFSCAITAASAVLPNVVPPSIAILIYAAIADESVARLFIAAIVPGLLLAGCLMSAVYVLAMLRGYGRGSTRASVRERLVAGGRALPVLFVVVIVVAGIRFGIITPTEAGAVAVAWSFAMWALLADNFRPRSIYEAFINCASEAATIGLLIGVAAPFAFVLISERVPQAFVSFALEGISDPWLILLMMNMIMLFAGTILNVSAAILILMPIFLPAVAAIGIDPVHFGLIVVVNLMLGGITPPVGILVYITSSISRTPVHRVFMEVLPLFAVLLLGLALVTYVPALSLSLGRWVF